MASLTDIYNSILSAVGAFNTGVTNLNTAVGDITGLSSNLGALATNITTLSSTLLTISSQVALIANNFVAPLVLNGYLSGLTIANASTNTTLAINFTQGIAADSSNLIYLRSTSAISKGASAVWSSGANGGMMGTGLTFTSSTWYHIFAISTSTSALGLTGAVDFYADTSVTAANIPSSMTLFRRIASVRASSSNPIWAPFTQNNDTFYWNVPHVENASVAVSTTATAGTTITLAAPTGISVAAIFGAIAGTAGAAGNGSYSCSLYELTGASSAFQTSAEILTAYVDSAGAISQIGGNAILQLYTNTSAQIGAIVNTRNPGGAGAQLQVTLSTTTLGWIDARGR